MPVYRFWLSVVHGIRSICASYNLLKWGRRGNTELLYLGSRHRQQLSDVWLDNGKKTAHFCFRLGDPELPIDAK